MVFGLGCDKLRHLFDVGITDRECRVPGLPGESLEIRKRLVDPARGVGLDLLKEFGHRRFTTERYQKVDMVGHATGGDERTILIPQNSTDVGIQSVGKVANQQGLAALGTEDQMSVQACE